MIRSLITVLTLLVLTSGCRMYSVEEREVNDSGLVKKILIAQVATKFKNQLVEKVVDSLKKENCFIKIIELEKLNEIDTSEYSAVLIVNELWAGTIDAEARKFLKKEFNKDKTVLVTTTGDSLVDLGVQKVDGITSASRIKDTDKIAEKAAKRLKIMADLE